MLKYDGYMMKITYEHNDYPMKHIDYQYTTYDQRLVVWNIFYFSIYWECHHPNWRTHIFQRGGSTTNQYIINPYNNH